MPTEISNDLLDPISGLPVIGDPLVENIKKFAYSAFGAGVVLAPPCVQQPKYSPTSKPKSSTTTLYPHVDQALNGYTTTRQKGK